METLWSQNEFKEAIEKAVDRNVLGYDANDKEHRFTARLASILSTLTARMTNNEYGQRMDRVKHFVIENEAFVKSFNLSPHNCQLDIHQIPIYNTAFPLTKIFHETGGTLSQKSETFKHDEDDVFVVLVVTEEGNCFVGSF